MIGILFAAGVFILFAFVTFFDDDDEIEEEIEDENKKSVVIKKNGYWSENKK